MTRGSTERRDHCGCVHPGVCVRVDASSCCLHPALWAWWKRCAAYKHLMWRDSAFIWLVKWVSLTGKEDLSFFNHRFSLGLSPEFGPWASNIRNRGAGLCLERNHTKKHTKKWFTVIWAPLALKSDSCLCCITLIWYRLKSYNWSFGFLALSAEAAFVHKSEDEKLAQQQHQSKREEVLETNLSTCSKTDCHLLGFWFQ